MKFVHIVAKRDTAKVHQVVSENQIALHMAISVDTATVNTTLKRFVGARKNQKLVQLRIIQTIVKVLYLIHCVAYPAIHIK